MTHQRALSYSATVVAASCLLAACGGGGGGSDASTSIAKPEGAYSGAITRRITVNTPAFEITNDVQLIVLEDGAFWAIFGSSSNGQPYLAGFINGPGTHSNGNYTVTGAQDFAFTSPPVSNVTATYVPNVSMSGTGTDSTGTLAFSTTATPSANYNYAKTSSVAEVAGSWNTLGRLFNPATLQISATGTLSGRVDGCDFTGSLVPRASGKNVFNSSIVFDPACPMLGTVSSGIAVSSRLPDGRQQLVIVGVIPSRTVGTMLLGTR